MRGERGSGSIVAVAVMAVILAFASLSIPLYVVLSAKQLVAGAADAAALAAADVAVGITAGAPCAVAESVASANGASLTACETDGLVVTVRATVDRFGFTVPAVSTAGPADYAGK